MLLGLQLQQREKLRRRTGIGRLYYTKSITARPLEYIPRKALQCVLAIIGAQKSFTAV
jgi:hypothetical protein